MILIVFLLSVFSTFFSQLMLLYAEAYFAHKSIRKALPNPVYTAQQKKETGQQIPFFSLCVLHLIFVLSGPISLIKNIYKSFTKFNKKY